jgi:phosphoribosylanthranilate isomerase
MVKIKICGISRKEDINYINETKPDYIGFVFAQSRRQVSDSHAMELRKELNSTIKSVGVFVNDDIKRVVELCNTGIIDMIQLHGDEGEDYISKLRTLTLAPIIKAVRVKCQRDIYYAMELSCDYLLLDTYKENQYGGCGETFDWRMVHDISKPFFLAGGLHSDNVLQAISQTNPYGIDVSSSVETDGYKDREKINTFINKVRDVK